MNLPHIDTCPHDLQAVEFGFTKELMAGFGHGNDPIAVMLTCWELGGAPDEVSSANPGQIMVVQNPGGLVAASNVPCGDSSLTSIVYAVTRPTVRHLIVCGHTDCKTLGLLIRQETQKRKNPLLERSEIDRLHAVNHRLIR